MIVAISAVGSPHAWRAADFELAGTSLPNGDQCFRNGRLFIEIRSELLAPAGQLNHPAVVRPKNTICLVASGHTVHEWPLRRPSSRGQLGNDWLNAK